MAARPTIVFHIGLEKTGTDSFQRFCKTNIQTLLTHGVLYPVSRSVFAGHNHRPLVACYLPYTDMDLGPKRARHDVLRSLRLHIEASKSDMVLISAEHFSSRFGDGEIAQLAEDFADYDCRIAVVVREHRARIRSTYAQTISSGQTLTFDDFCNAYLQPANRYLRYRDTITPWERTFGRANMQVFSLTPETNVVEMLCKALIPSALTRLDLAYWENKSLGVSATEAQRRINMVLPPHEPFRRDPTGKLKWLLLYLPRRLIRTLIATAAVSESPQGHFHMSKQNHDSLQELADSDREWLAARYNLYLGSTIPDCKPLVSETLAYCRTGHDAVLGNVADGDAVSELCSLSAALQRIGESRRVRSRVRRTPPCYGRSHIGGA